MSYLAAGSANGGVPGGAPDGPLCLSGRRPVGEDRRAPHTDLKLRGRTLALVAFLWLGVVAGRLVHLQLFQHAELRARAQRQQQRLVEVTPKRGILFDRNGRELAMSIQVDSCFAVPSELADPRLASRLLGKILKTESEELLSRFRSSRSFCWVARKVDPVQVEQIRRLNLKGIYFQKENRRFYPKGTLAAHALGYVDIDEKGLGGIEYSMDALVRGRPGRLLILADGRRRSFDRSETEATLGANVVLTLDENIQYVAEKELAAAMEKTRALAGTVIVQNPNNGEILAMANAPTFNPNAVSASKLQARVNRAISAAYEPGSTFKMITLSAAMEEGLTRPEELVDCQDGSIVLANHRIRDHKPFATLSVAEVLSHSSDVGAIKIGLRLGERKFYDYIRAYGFGQPTSIELPGENRGLLRQIENWSGISIGSISMGQEVGVTALQALDAMSAIGNGGVLYQPHILREIHRSGGTPERVAPEGRRVISPRTAAMMRRMLEGVVLEGTGQRARLNGYTAAGKTGTAQKLDPATGTYSRSQYVASFVGIAPLNNPAISLIVVLDSPVGAHQGGEVAAPVFSRIAQQVLTYLDIPHDVPFRPLEQARGEAREEAMDLTDFASSQVEAVAGDAMPRTPALSAASFSAAPNTEGTVGWSTQPGVEVPSFIGKSVREVTEECFRLGLSPILVGNGIAAEQIPPAGSRVPPGSRLTVRFARIGEAHSRTFVRARERTGKKM